MSKDKIEIKGNEATVKNNPVKKKGMMEFLSKEYKYENLILVILAVFAIVLGALIISGTLTISESFFLIGTYSKVFAWVLVALGTVSLLLVAYPFYKPSFGEVKHLSGLSKGTFIENIIQVLIFIAILVLFFFLCDLLLDYLFAFINK